MEIYSQENISKNSFFRTFSEEIDKYELVWHYDINDRDMTVISGSDWMFQYDDTLPFKLNVGDNIFIPKNTYHRIIKGCGDLIIKIEER
jgi:mannose-6-phosphate isomerase-like protein (cupin superfamily)